MSQLRRPLSERWRHDLEALAHLHGFTLERLQRRDGRFAPMIEARRACFAYLREQGWSYPQIGALFNRDHTTILYALQPDQRKADKNRRTMQAYWRKRGIAA